MSFHHGGVPPSTDLSTRPATLFAETRQSQGLKQADLIHVSLEALKFAFADRDTYYADPRF
jgi:gamma-glutamyltranspeptidase